MCRNLISVLIDQDNSIREVYLVYLSCISSISCGGLMRERNDDDGEMPITKRFKSIITPHFQSLYENSCGHNSTVEASKFDQGL